MFKKQKNYQLSAQLKCLTSAGSTRAFLTCCILFVDFTILGFYGKNVFPVVLDLGGR